MSQQEPVVPLIDLGPFFKAQESQKQQVAQQIGKACREIGFFIITNHGIPKEVIDVAWNAGRTFFDLPIQDKREVLMTDDYPYGYCSFGSEVLSYSKNIISGADLKESFNICIGSENPASDHIPAIWPSKPAELKTSWTIYYRHMEKLAANLLRLFALALNLPEDYFEDKINQHLSAMRTLNYPHQTEKPIPGQIRASEHTDYGTLTILYQQDAIGGLQVKRRNGDWEDVKAKEGTFVINIGDLMARWTNDEWVSTLHRVVNPPVDSKGDTRRQSMVFFHNLNNDAVVQCIETCCSETRPPKYEPVLAGQYLLSKHAATVKKKS